VIEGTSTLASSESGDRTVSLALLIVQNRLRWSHDAAIRVYDEVGNVIETHEHKGDFKEPLDRQNPMVSAEGLGAALVWALFSASARA
jgi:hypothetical protein